MKKRLLPILFASAVLVAQLFPGLNAGSKSAPQVSTLSSLGIVTAPVASVLTEDRAVAALAATQLYDSLKLEQKGLSFEAMMYAYMGYLQLKEKGALRNESVLSICDFSQSSSKKRLYIIDVKNFKVLKNTYVAHGKNSGLQYASNFSNTPESLQSSLGFYVTEGTYIGKHGLSLRLDGQETGINSKAMERAIVVHGADYIGPHRLGAPYMGRSFGCPAVPQAESDFVINTIKNGTCLFIYHPSKTYLHSSKLLKGLVGAEAV